MNHPSEEDLVLHLYGEADESDFLAKHLESCARCREELAVLRQVLAEVDEMTPPERPSDYGARVWERVSKDLKLSRAKTSRSYYWLAAAAVLLLATFLAGRFTARPPTKLARPGQIRERILLVALSDHLEQSQVLLLEVVNRDDGSASPIAPLERARAGELLQASRLYRQTAYQVGEVAAADVLEDLERILLDMSQGPESLEAREGMKSRIEERDLLFKLRVLGSNVKKF
jgi:anti-sigma factor RsiW